MVSCMMGTFGLINLIEWLKAMIGNRKSEELIDLNLPEKPSSKVLKLCSVDATKRPKIGQIIHMLEADEILFSDSKSKMIQHCYNLILIYHYFIILSCRNGGLEGNRCDPMAIIIMSKRTLNRDRKQIGEEITD
ncbi:hypothetical protein Ahy_A05g022751 [Arachis hypogaea]|uniref:non-specific serine/threonine protein kinase n=1 Tax=Arachis hypogaea TaxID=3818 RepID=A0A445D1I2_ARAHY|nr:hypothetical protein Ahy_A05g022751 [Arachis hypogaea]